MEHKQHILSFNDWQNVGMVDCAVAYGTLESLIGLPSDRNYNQKQAMCSDNIGEG